MLGLALAAPLAAHAQTSYPDDNARAQAPYPDDNWIPQGMEVLGRNAAFHTDFTFNKQMLDAISGLTTDEETQHIVAKLRGISVHVYRYAEPGLYDPSALDAVRLQYRDRGWKHLVTQQSKVTSDHRGRTDLWIRFDHDNVEGIVVLLQNPTNLDLIAVNGTLSPLDLMHLRGHFGIPRDDGSYGGDHFVPDNH